MLRCRSRSRPCFSFLPVITSRLVVGLVSMIARPCASRTSTRPLGSSTSAARSEQQDRVAILWSDTACLAVLADGMGGEIRGAFAAQMVIDAASYQFHGLVQDSAADLLTLFVETADELINTGWKSSFFPGSTCVLLHLTPSKATWTNVGDSRLYRFQDGRYFDRTVDHTSVDLARLDGRLSEEEARVHPRKEPSVWVPGRLAAAAN